MAKKKEKMKEPQYYSSAINSQVLNYRVYVMKAGEKLLYSFIAFVLAGMVGLIFYGGLFKKDGESTLTTLISNVVTFCLIGAIGIKIIVPAMRERLRKKRLKTLRLQFREFLTALSNSLSGGMNVPDALEHAYQDLVGQFSADAYIAQEVQEILQGVRNNIPVEEMLADFGKRSGVEDISNFAVVFATCYRTGGNIKSVVRRTTDIISEKMIVEEEIQTAMTSNKTQLYFMTVLPIGLTFIMRMLSSEFSESFASPLGIVVLSIAVCFFIAAYKMGQKIMDIKG